MYHDVTYQDFIIKPQDQGFFIYHSEGSTFVKTESLHDQIDIVDNAEDFIDDLYTRECG